MIVEFEPVQAKRSLPKLVRTPAERQKMQTLFDALDADPHLDDRQRELVVELRKLLPIGPTSAARASRRTTERTVAARRRAPADVVAAA
jgi:hypothetical protein